MPLDKKKKVTLSSVLFYFEDLVGLCIFKKQPQPQSGVGCASSPGWSVQANCITCILPSARGQGCVRILKCPPGISGRWWAKAGDVDHFFFNWCVFMKLDNNTSFVIQVQTGKKKQQSFKEMESIIFPAKAKYCLGGKWGTFCGIVGGWRLPFWSHLSMIDDALGLVLTP